MSGVFYKRVLAKMSGSSSAGFSAVFRNIKFRTTKGTKGIAFCSIVEAGILPVLGAMDKRQECRFHGLTRIDLFVGFLSLISVIGRFFFKLRIARITRIVYCGSGSCEHRTSNNEQRTSNVERRATCNYQPSTNAVVRVTGNGQTTINE